MRRAAVALLATLALAPAASAQCPQTSLVDIEDEVFCPQCGVPLALATDAPQAKAQREFIRELVEDDCASKQEVKDALVAQFGERVLAEPGNDGFDIAAWAVPAIALIAASGGLALAFARWRRAPAPVEGDAAPAPLSGPDSDRLDEDMARYDR